MHDRLFDRLQRFRKPGTDECGIGLVGNDEKLPVDEPVRARWIAPRRASTAA